MGARFGSECYADAATAASAQCSSITGVTSAGYMRCTAVGGTAEAPTLTLSTLAPDGSASSPTLSVSYLTCDPFEPYADTSLMFSYGLLAVLGVFLLREFVLRFLRPQ